MFSPKTMLLLIIKLPLSLPMRCILLNFCQIVSIVFYTQIIPLYHQYKPFYLLCLDVRSFDTGLRPRDPYCCQGLLHFLPHDLRSAAVEVSWDAKIYTFMNGQIQTYVMKLLYQ